MRLLFVRHGDPDYVNDTLTEKGHREAKLLAEIIEQYRIDEVYQSPLGRAKDTASYSCKKLEIEPVTLDWLKEFPAQANPNISEDVRKAYANELQKDEVTGEFEKFLKENGYEKEGMAYRVSENNDKTIAFYCHYGLTSLLLSYLWNVSPFVVWQFTALAPTSVTEVVTEEREKGIATFRTLRAGEITHLRIGNEEPSFSARFCERYENEDERH